MSMVHWSLISQDIKQHYDYFDSFVVLHGTDTMAYTASALSYMFENLDKTVVITGSQVWYIFYVGVSHLSVGGWVLCCV